MLEKKYTVDKTVGVELHARPNIGFRCLGNAAGEGNIWHMIR